MRESQLLTEWSVSKKEELRYWSIPHLFEVQVEQIPDSIALVFEEQQITYRELNRRTNQLAYILRQRGVGPEVLVGICIKRSLEMVIAIIGILKSGGAYVPLDPTYPQDRLTVILEDTQVALVITQREQLSQLTCLNTQLFLLDRGWDTVFQEEETNQVSSILPQNLAYVIYTSGSTGRPKGVQMSHQSLTNFLLWQIEDFTFGDRARVLQFASLNFDVSFQEIFSTLGSGGTLVMITEILQRDPLCLWNFLLQEGFDRVFIPYVMLQQIASIAGRTPENMPIGLREIITSGEQLQITPQIENFFYLLAGCVLHNQYGPSENHGATAYVLSKDPQNWPLLPPIGRPITNVEVYLLDSHLEPIPIGVPGELYIGGIGLSRGYLRQPEVTAERFIPSPFHKSFAARLYKTGDKARFLADGTLEFLGRSDYQVKIRGLRIELGEIEVTLAQYPGVQKVVAIVREDIPGEKRLVVYLVAVPGQTLRGGDMRAFLKGKLPTYMIPAGFVLLDAIPLTPNGKINRQALLSLPFKEEDRECVPPRTKTEQIIVTIWTQVLNLKRIGIYDNFFEIGGDSLVATQIILRLRDAFKLDLSLSVLFETLTVAKLADFIDATRWATEAFHIPPENLLSGYEENEI